MISTYQLKSRFQSLLRPLAFRLHRAGISANQVTVTAALISLLLGGFALHYSECNYIFLLISLWCLMRMAANALDGMLAREYGQASPLGAVLNEAGDVISDIALYLPFAFISGSSGGLVAGILLLAVLSEFGGWLGTVKSHARRNDGPMGKSDRALVFGTIALLIGCGISLAPYLNMLWWIILALLVLTTINRVRSAAAVQKHRDSV